MSNAKIRHRRQRRRRTRGERKLENVARFWATAALWDADAMIDSLSWRLDGDILRVKLTATKLGAIESVVNGTVEF